MLPDKKKEKRKNKKNSGLEKFRFRRWATSLKQPAINASSRRFEITEPTEFPKTLSPSPFFAENQGKRKTAQFRWILVPGNSKIPLFFCFSGRIFCGNLLHLSEPNPSVSLLTSFPSLLFLGASISLFPSSFSRIRLLQWITWMLFFFSFFAYLGSR